METSLKTGFAQIFSRYPKNLSCPKFGGAAAPLAPPGPYAYGGATNAQERVIFPPALADPLPEFSSRLFPTPPLHFSPNVVRIRSCCTKRNADYDFFATKILLG